MLFVQTMEFIVRQRNVYVALLAPRVSMCYKGPPPELTHSNKGDSSAFKMTQVKKRIASMKPSARIADDASPLSMSSVFRT